MISLWDLILFQLPGSSFLYDKTPTEPEIPFQRTLSILKAMLPFIKNKQTIQNIVNIFSRSLHQIGCLKGWRERKWFCPLSWSFVWFLCRLPGESEEPVSTCTDCCRGRGKIKQFRTTNVRKQFLIKWLTLKEVVSRMAEIIKCHQQLRLILNYVPGWIIRKKLNSNIT